MLNRIVHLILLNLLLLGWVNLNANPVKLDNVAEESSFKLVNNGKPVSIFIDSLDAEVVKITSSAFSSDVEMVVGLKPEIKISDSELSEYPLIAGTIGKSKWIDILAKKGMIPVDDIKGKWESYLIAVIDKPFKGVKKALVVAGSDRRGTAYGIFELSKIMGVSPWVYWADVHPLRRDNVGFTNGYTIYGSPSVKYRGIFLNDEDWGLQPWAAKHFDTNIKDIGPKTYAKIFELLLRLKANFIWPAMHPCTKAFYYYPENPVVADKYAIVVGSSHCEPILRNNVFEWKENYENEYGVKPNEWRYDLNKDQIYKYWDDRAKQSSHFESVYTIGMRGIHDGSMPGPKDINAKIDLLNKVIVDQRNILQNELGKPANQIPQIFCPYKEVLTLYQRGIDLPDDVTIVWADDNHGYVRQLSTPEEQLRSGRSGVYYHISYWGAPHDYLWLSSVSPSLISYELSKAYAYGADRLWVINVGDIKPAEMEMEFAMDLAWNIENWKPEHAHLFIKDWAIRTFGKEYADDIYDIKREYYRLAHAAKPEHMGMVEFTEEEANQRFKDYQKLAQKAEDLKSRIPDRLQDAYFELIFYPVMGAKLMNEKILFAKRSMNEMKKGMETSLVCADRAKEAFDEIKRLTDIYNHEIAGGRWDGIMDWKPRNLEVYKMPEVASVEKLGEASEIVFDNEGANQPLKQIINASKYTGDHLMGNGVRFTTIEGLGIGDEGITLFPYNWPSVVPDSVKSASYLDYEVNLEQGDHQVEVIALPTHRIHKGRNLRYAVSIDGEDPQIVDLNTPSKSKQWSIDVLRGYHKGETNHHINQSGNAVLRIYFLDPGLVVNQIKIK